MAQFSEADHVGGGPVMPTVEMISATGINYQEDASKPILSPFATKLLEMPKRKAKQTAGDVDEPRRSSRRIKTAEDKVETASPAPAPPVPTVPKPKKTPKSSKASAANVNGTEEKITTSKSLPVENASSTTLAAPLADDASTGRQYWLMKAEPETRLEKGHDVRFSIDDLASKTGPEPWDGIRAYAARNNIRAMRKGDLAFFYHSNCKVPAIVGVMEIVEEHSPDLSAHDSSAPYYDPSSTPENPKWSVVHVTFRQKLNTPVTLKELKEWYTQKGHPLENMQVLKLARMSVSKVSAKEWDFLTVEMKKRGDEIKQ
ncbi:hypothetical protein G7Y89_g2956 [Cudoniella acicularis]|uniref:Thymocyte nuclear protein 1 n=1 Tax=Cudoniella acicularis TaxID=354080 RepID=A0A8H4RU45_9HELO|nr:hypothetical protein G7Y89_g2956 [Cudoniella acicularis]